MSDNNDDTLLDGDFGDELDYDLGNEDEDALLADDYDLQTTSHRSVYLEDQQDGTEGQDGFRREPEEPLEDVLDLGVTEGDALDDLDSEIQDSQEQRGGESTKRMKLHRQPSVVHNDSVRLDNSGLADSQQQVDVTDSSQISQETSYVETEDLGTSQVAGTGMESEEEEEETEGESRDRFKSERTTIVSLKGTNKSYGNIPDSLDNVCVEDVKQIVRRDGGWRGRRGRGGRGGGPRPHFGPGNQFNVHPQQQQQQQQQQHPQQFQMQQQFGGPRFGPGNRGFPRPSMRGVMRGGPMFNRPQMNPQQQPRPPQLPPPPPQQQPHPHQQQQLQQPPHKILINPHFRGAVQPYPDARLIWDTEMGNNQGQVPPPQGDGHMPFPSDIQPMEPQYQPVSQGGYGVQQFQPPPHQQQMESQPLPPSPLYEVSPQQGNYFPPEQNYGEPPAAPHWQEQPQVTEVYVQPGPMGMNTNNVPVSQHDPTFHQPNHGMGDMNINHGQQGGPMYGGGVEQFESSNQQMFVEGGNYPPPGMPPQPNYHPQQQHPPQMSPGGHNLPPPMMGMYRMHGPPGPPGGMKFRNPGQGQFHPQGYMNQRGRPPRGGPRYPGGGQMNAPRQQMIRGRRPPMHLAQQQPQQQQQMPVPLQNRSPKKRPSFDATPISKARFDPAAKRKKRMPDMSNLHEVQTVELPSTDLGSMEYMQPDEEEDEETREYRKKIEQQKLERERFLQRKEERRKLAALKKQKELVKIEGDVLAAGDAPLMVPGEEPPQGNAIATIVNRNTIEPAPQPQVRNIQQQRVQNIANRVPVQQQQLQTFQKTEMKPPPASVGAVRQQQMRGGRGMGFRGRGVGRGQQKQAMRQQQQPQTQMTPQQQQREQLMQQKVAQALIIVPPQTPEVKKVVEKGMVAVAPGQRIVRPPQPGTAAGVAQSGGPPRRLVLAQGAGHQVRQQLPRPAVQQVQQSPRQVVQQQGQQLPRQIVQKQGQQLPRQVVQKQGQQLPRQVVQKQGQQIPRQVVQQQGQQQVQKGRTVVLRGATGGGGQPAPQQKPQQVQQMVGSQRIVVASKPVPQQGVGNRQVAAAGGRQVVASKTVVTQQQNAPPQQPVLPRTKVVQIDNLAASTTDHQLKSMCQGVGAVENIQMLTKQRRAILKFVNPTSAATFYKRYQRKIVDLSLISVSLIPQ